MSNEKRLWIIEAKDGAWGANGILKGELVRCGECKYDGRCMFQSFVIDNSRDEVPYDKNTFYCADGERKDGADDGRTD